jgi:hypothetical protein
VGLMMASAGHCEVIVQFSIHNDDKSHLEGESAEGAVRIWSMCSQKCISYRSIQDDELAALIQNLCFGSIPKLLRGETVRVLNCSYSGHLDMIPCAEDIEIKGSHFEKAIYPKTLFLFALFECGESFLKKSMVMSKSSRVQAEYISNNFVPAAKEALFGGVDLRGVADLYK